MKRFFIERRNEWKGGAWIDWNLIQIGGEYDKLEPCLYLRVSLFGLGFEIAFLCPWETEESKEFKKTYGILSVEDDDEDTSV